MKIEFQYSEFEMLSQGVKAHRVKMWVDGVFYCGNFAPLSDSSKYKKQSFADALIEVGNKILNESKLEEEINNG